MIATEVSIVIPMCDMDQSIEGIIRLAASQVAELNAEFLVVDMGSHDRSVLRALTVIKERKLNGYVVQNGSGTVGSAFNTGICKASGEYVTFLFPRRLYAGFIPSYYETAKASSADFIYGTPAEEKTKNGVITGEEAALRAIQGKMPLDIGAVFLRRSFLLEKQVFFEESCTFGYSEEFILRALLSASRVAQSPAVMQRNLIYELPEEKEAPIGIRCFERVEALKRILDLIRASHATRDKLLDCFLQQKLPDAVLSCVDTLLAEGVGYNATRGAVRLRKYDCYLSAGKNTGILLRRQLTTWRLMPWMYHSRLEKKK